MFPDCKNSHTMRKLNDCMHIRPYNSYKLQLTLKRILLYQIISSNKTNFLDISPRKRTTTVWIHLASRQKPPPTPPLAFVSTGFARVEGLSP